jgi:hypothetical protein
MCYTADKPVQEVEVRKMKKPVLFILCFSLLFLSACAGTSAPVDEPSPPPAPSPTEETPSRPGPTPDPAAPIIAEFYGNCNTGVTVLASVYNEFRGKGVLQLEMLCGEGELTTYHLSDIEDGDKWPNDDDRLHFHGGYLPEFLLGLREDKQLTITYTLGYYDDNGENRPAHRSNPLYLALTVDPEPVRIDSVYRYDGFPSWTKESYMYGFTGEMDDETFYIVFSYERDGSVPSGYSFNHSFALDGALEVNLSIDAVYATVQKFKGFTSGGDTTSVTISYPQDPMIELELRIYD